MVETDLTLVDYFSVIGFDKSVGLKPDHSADVISDYVEASTSNQTQPPLERSYVARILAHFPEKRPGFPFAQEISSLCMPKGLRFYTEKSVPLEPKFHSFVNIREDGTRINGCCLTLYEEVRDEQLRQEMINPQMEHVKDLAMVEKSTQERVHHPPGTIPGGNHTLPSTSKPIFVSKCICLIARTPIIYTAEKILRGLADMISINRPVLSLPMESFIYWFLHEVPLPVPGTILRVPLNDCDLIVKRPSVNELPFFDYPFQTIFSYISVEKFVKLFTCFLLEHQILLCSKHLDRLMLIAESLTTFVFPFRWQLAYVPILPYSQLNFIEAPVPYLMGLCYDDNIPDQIYQSNICILDIDTGKLDLPEEVPPFPRHRQLASEIVSIIKKMNESLDENSAHHQTLLNQEAKAYLQRLKFNNAIRELILYHFGCLFHNYESFLISDTSEQDSLDGYMSNRDSVVNFDKASFLSDQPDSYLPFLAAFLETQMFTSFVDSKVLSQWHKPDENIVLFDQKLVVLREKLGIVNTTRTPIIDNPLEFMFSEDSSPLKIDQLKSDYEVPRPHALNGAAPRAFDGTFPELESRLFENSLESPWKEKIVIEVQKQMVIEDSIKSPYVTAKEFPTNDDTDQNCKFVEQLLKETKTKTKRMLVVKMGKEAVHLGRDDLDITGVEENTLVAGFCDLLERVWAHGLEKKQGKSAFWMHVLSHQENEKNMETLNIPDNASNMSPDLAVSYERKRSLSRPRSQVEYEKQLTPLSTHISYDLKNILRMTEIKTDIGFARAFVRLALERKLLYKHLKEVLSNTNLLQEMYKEYAFLRYEEEREQFLYYILSLNAVDFSCFTHTFISTKMQYEVLLVASIDRYHASSIWVMITGSLGSTNNISLPANSLQFAFDYKNLGVLSTMRIGRILRKKGKNPSKWFLDYVLVRNNITGQTFRFNCGRWFGRGVDDGALERLLVADVLPRSNDMDPEDGISSFGSTSSFGGLISRPESPDSSVLSTRGYSTSSLTRKPRRSHSVGRPNEISSSKRTSMITQNLLTPQKSNF